MAVNGTMNTILSKNPTSKDIAEEMTPEAIDKAMQEIIASVPKQPSSH